MKKAIYAFSGDPITYGHIDIIERATRVFDEVTVAIGINAEKEYMFSLTERTRMAKKALGKLPGVRVVAFEGLLVDYAFEHNIPVIIKGLRNSKDFDYELMLHQMSKSQQMEIDTFFLPAKQDLIHISSSSAKALQLEQGLIHEYVPLNVKQSLEAKISGQYMVGITGEIGAGKSFLSDLFVKMGKERHIDIHNIELDHIGHQITGNLSEPLYRKVRREITEKFGEDIRREDGSIDRKKLGDIVFNNHRKLSELNKILYTPLLLRLRRDLYMKKGIVLFNAALIAESAMEHLCNNNVILVTVDKETQRQRLYGRNLSNEQIEKRLKSQYNAEKKLQKLQKKIDLNFQGKLWAVDNSRDKEPGDFTGLFNEVVATLDIYGELRLHALYERLGIAQDFPGDYKALVKAYAFPRRYEHTLVRLLNQVSELEKIRRLCVGPDILEAALWYYRIVFDTTQNNAIEESARFAYDAYARSGLPADFCSKVAYYIRCTNHQHTRLKDDADYLVDLDLLSLGKPGDVFLEYENNIRREYFWMDNPRYRQFRKSFYSRLLERPRIYLSDYFREQYEEQARENLSGYLGGEVS